MDSPLNDYPCNEQAEQEALDSYTKRIAGITEPAGYSGAPVGIGGAPARASTLPTDAKERKTYPIASGLLDYFPDALAAVAHVSYVANEQHNPGKPLHWDRSKSGDEADALMRHFLERGGVDKKDGLRESAKLAWRALALLQKEIESEKLVVSSAAQAKPLYDYYIDEDGDLFRFPAGTQTNGNYLACKTSWAVDFWSLDAIKSPKAISALQAIRKFPGVEI